MNRRLGGVIVIDGTDHEWLLPNEYGHLESAVDQPLTAGQGPIALRVPHLKFGGEVRIEVQLTAAAQANGEVQVSGAAKLYEGTSEQTSDLDDEKRITLTIPRGGTPVVQRFSLGQRKGDSASILVCLTNALAE
jgi:hypothetical protein